MFNVLIDTCVWLDLADKPQQTALLRAGAPRERFAFVTDNKHDFSAVVSDDRQPHADIDSGFSRLQGIRFD